MKELTDSFALLKKMLQSDNGTDNKLEIPSNSSNIKEVSTESEIQSETSDLDKNAHDINLVCYRSSYELETILIFDLCALSEIATSKSAILRVRMWLYLKINCYYET